jgi:hypothetical protein
MELLWFPAHMQRVLQRQCAGRDILAQRVEPSVGHNPALAARHRRLFRQRLVSNDWNAAQDASRVPLHQE